MSAKTADGPTLLSETAELASAANFAAVATELPSGRIQNQVLWVHTDGERLLLNTETHRTKYHNVQRNSKITVLIRDESDPYRYAEVRGHVTDSLSGDEARSQVDEMAVKYTGEKYPPENIKSTRVLLYVTPERQTFVDQNAGVAD